MCGSFSQKGTGKMSCIHSYTHLYMHTFTHTLIFNYYLRYCTCIPTQVDCPDKNIYIRTYMLTKCVFLQGIEDLLDKVLLQAEIMNLKSLPDVPVQVMAQYLLVICCVYVQ